MTVTNNGMEQTNEATSPWVFVDHLRDDERGDTVFRMPCPGSGGNKYTATNSW
uniref:hypothetical protein n=1 Tax=unclassified Rhodococcus (in: high G+C Gram-positive bacteria) TaxID=192944 RepID=UPI0015953B89|nr:MULTISPECIES: hypothetical protein [unclassified Rhodococcus (in: high G+C Gram-positive bacteria)]